MDFNEISTVNEMLSFLKTQDRENKYYHHYTDLDTLIKIIESGYFHLTRGNSMSMNDQHESQTKGNQSTWQKTFLGCFAFGKSENMAMWGLYGLPWEDAVRISIPAEKMTNWINNMNAKDLYTVSFDNGSCQRAILNTPATVTLSDIVYIEGKRNSDSSVLFWDNESLQISDAQKLSGIGKKSSMTGFIKNYAWKYEKEVRIHVLLSRKLSADEDTIAIKLSNDIIASMTITTGPYFSGELLQRIEERVSVKLFQRIKERFFSDNIKIKKSKFKGLVKYKTLCKMCVHKEFQKKEG